MALIVASKVIWWLAIAVTVVRWLQETKQKATHEGDKAKLRWLDPHLAGRELQQIDRTVIDHIKYLRERQASTGTANRYLALVRAILRRA
jgi:hypothetical protein